MTNPAEGYEAYMVPSLFAPWASRLIERADPKPGERVLDVGCGTGIVARQIGRRLGANAVVAAVDLSPDMLAVAKVKAADEGVAVEWREGSAEKLPFPGASFDLVISQFALMFFADKVAALADMRRVLTVGGRIVLSVWQGLDKHPFYDALHRAIERRLGISELQDIFMLGDADALRVYASGAGLRRVEIERASMTARFPNPAGFLAGEIEVDTAAIPSMQHLDARARQAIVAAISTDMELEMKAVTQGGYVVIPFHAYFLSALQ